MKEGDHSLLTLIIVWQSSGTRRGYHIATLTLNTGTRSEIRDATQASAAKEEELAVRRLTCDFEIKASGQDNHVGREYLRSDLSPQSPPLVSLLDSLVKITRKQAVFEGKRGKRGSLAPHRQPQRKAACIPGGWLLPFSQRDSCVGRQSLITSRYTRDDLRFLSPAALHPLFPALRLSLVIIAGDKRDSSSFQVVNCF